MLYARLTVDVEFEDFKMLEKKSRELGFHGSVPRLLLHMAGAKIAQDSIGLKVPSVRTHETTKPRQ